MSIARLLTPKSVAVIGGGVWGRSIIEQLQKIGFTGDIHVVHPKTPEICGITTVPDLDAIGAPIDAAFVGVNREATIDIVRALSARGCGGAVCFASGFREAVNETADGGDLQDALVAAAGDLPIIAPNCYGIINYFDQFCLWPDQHGGRKVDRGVALISQSSNIMINLTMQSRGLPIGYAVTVGNQAKIGFADLGVHLLEDPRVSALGLHIEGINDIRALERLARRARELGKGIVAIKVGKSDQARAATISHTASLAGEDAGADALLSRLGIGRADTLEVFLETLKILHVAGPLPGHRIGSLSCSGGEASLMADLGIGRHVQFPPLTEIQFAGLRSALGPKVALANPLDYHTYIWGDTAAMAATFAAMADADGIDVTVVVADFPRTDRCSRDAWQCVFDAVRQARSTTGKTFAILASLVENLAEEIADDLIRDGIIPLCGMADAIDAVSIAAQIGQSVPTIDDVLLPNAEQAGHVLSEYEAKRLLAEYGIALPQACVRDASALQEPIDIPFPVVLKAQGIAHKSDAGGVRIGIADHASIVSAAQDMGFSSYLIEEMIADGGLEILIGVQCDPAHGFILTLAAGGVMTEILQDSVSMILPVSSHDIDHALGRLKIAPLFDGFRGRPKLARTAVVDAVLAVQAFVVDHKTSLAEVEINPIIVTPTRAVAVDALIKQSQRSQ